MFGHPNAIRETHINVEVVNRPRNCPLTSTCAGMHLYPQPNTRPVMKLLNGTATYLRQAFAGEQVLGLSV